MHQSNPWQSYRQVATKTASPGQLVLMLFDGALRFLEQARAGFALDDPLEFNLTIHNNIQKAVAIVSELNYSLNMEAGGEFSATMRRLYDYMDRQLHEANQYKREDHLIDVSRRLGVIRDAWKEMLEKQGADFAPLTTLTAVG
ncbi:MAG: flagellar biosynthesis protein FliS [Verrucomicrobiales bacterium]|jgi:flagellar protein FliS|nr:flagellar biosynthesis protein FliS [Verrucomicrobiales bacterium]